MFSTSEKYFTIFYFYSREKLIKIYLKPDDYFDEANDCINNRKYEICFDTG